MIIQLNSPSEKHLDVHRVQRHDGESVGGAVHDGLVHASADLSHLFALLTVEELPEVTTLNHRETTP